MGKETLDFTGHKLTFLDWKFIYPGHIRVLAKDAPLQSATEMIPTGIQLKIFSPEISHEKVFKPEKPWEMSYMSAYTTVFWDDQYHGGCYRFYYELFTPRTAKWSDHDTILCYAESYDGIHWDRPNLVIVDFNGSKDNNILFSPDLSPYNIGVHGTHIFRDDNPRIPAEERYKMSYCGPKNKTYACYSHDGIRWKLKDGYICETEADSQNVIYWDSQSQKYIGYFRNLAYERRGIARAESANFWHWPKPDIVYRTDPNIGVDTDYYTNAFHIWPGTETQQDSFVMFPAMYHQATDHLSIEFLVSSTGMQWFRPKDNPIFSPHARSISNQGAVYVGKGIWPDGQGNWQMFWTLYQDNHNAGDRADPINPPGGVYQAKWPEDGFCGLQAETFGEFWTVEFIASCSKIVINGVTHDKGWIKIGLYDTLTRQELEEYTIDECELLTGKLWNAPVQWKGQSDFKEYDDVHMRLHIKMFEATIYSIRFEK